MNRTAIALLAVVGVALAGYAEAAQPKKRTRNQNRIGPYAVGFLGHTSYTSDFSRDEDIAVDLMLQFEPFEVQNLRTSTDDSAVGYHAVFGYRFTRHIAAEISLVQLGKATSRANAELDFGGGLQPSTLSFTFNAGGPMISALGILPLNDKFELFGRLGFLLADAKREARIRVGNERAYLGSAKGNSDEVIFGGGASYHFNQQYSLRLEYLKFDSLGDPQRSGTEDANQVGLGLVVRF